MVGERFGYLVVDEVLGNKVKCTCDCGEVKMYGKQNVKSGRTKSCGCFKVEKLTKHGMYNTHFYRAWARMNSRCRSDDPTIRPYYKDKRIVVWEEWSDFLKFKEGMYESYLRHVKEFGESQTTLDRIDVDGDYEPGNVRWATWRTQIRNRGLNRNNTSGHTGISYMKSRGKWRVRITVDGKEIHLGMFESIEDAIRVRKEYENKLEVDSI